MHYFPGLLLRTNTAKAMIAAKATPAIISVEAGMPWAGRDGEVTVMDRLAG